MKVPHKVQNGALSAMLIVAAMLGAQQLHAADSLSQDNTRQNRVAALVKTEQVATLASQIDGLISQINVKAGDSFVTGDVLLRLDCTLQLATVNKAKAQVEYARNEYRSQKGLQKLNSSTKAQVARSAAEFAKANADLEMASYQSRQCDVVAPFDGTVVQSWVMPFETVNAKTDLLRIVNNDDLSVEFLVPSDYLKALSTGKSFELTISETGRNYQLEINKIIPMVDSVNRTIRVISHLDNSDNELWAGMSGWAQLD